MSSQGCVNRHGRRNGHLIQRQTICTVNPRGRGACTGDDGSPLTLRNGTVIGVVSHFTFCGQGLPDIYFDLWYGIPFIRQTTQISNLPHGIPPTRS